MEIKDTKKDHKANLKFKAWHSDMNSDRTYF